MSEEHTFQSAMLMQVSQILHRYHKCILLAGTVEVLQSYRQNAVFAEISITSTLIVKLIQYTILLFERHVLLYHKGMIFAVVCRGSEKCCTPDVIRQVQIASFVG